MAVDDNIYSKTAIFFESCKFFVLGASRHASDFIQLLCGGKY